MPSIAIPKTTEVLVIETPKEGVTFPQVFAVMPQEIRATVKLYLDGKIREWYSAAMARASSCWSTRSPWTRRERLMEDLPLAKGS